MAEKRKPDTVLWVRHGTRRSFKVELFRAEQFSTSSRFTNKQGEPIWEFRVPGLHHRLRVNGVWFPAGRRVLYTQQQALDLISKEIFRHETD